MLFHRPVADDKCPLPQKAFPRSGAIYSWRKRSSFQFFLGIVFTILSVLSQSTALGGHSNDTLPAAEQVVQQVLEKARQAQSLRAAHQYEFRRSVLTEELDGNGQSKKKRRRFYRMLQVPGELSPRRVSQFSTEEAVDLGQERKKEKPAKGNRSERMEFKLDDDLINRFVFKVAGREYINRRSSLLLTFEPKPDLPVNQMEDRVINKIRGRAWVDEQDNEVSRLELSLSDNVSLAWGILGNLHRFNLVLERAKIDNSIWLNQTTSGFVEYRKILASKAIRWQEQMSEFQKVHYTPEQLKAISR